MLESVSSLSFPTLLPLAAKRDNAWCYDLLSIVPNETRDSVLFMIHMILENISHVRRVTQWLNTCVHFMCTLSTHLQAHNFKQIN
jgi:hypothetical protein